MKEIHFTLLKYGSLIGIFILVIVYIKMEFWNRIKYRFRLIKEFFERIFKSFEKLSDTWKKLIIGLVVLFLSFLLASWVGTQMFARKLNYNSYFSPMFRIKDFPIYFPFAGAYWFLKLRHIGDYRMVQAIRTGLNSFYNTLLFLSLLLCVGAYFKKQKLTSHGTARWITTKELFKSGFLHKGKEPYPDGVILGRDEKGNTVVDNEKTHISVIAPTRSGKGVGIIIPSLINWRGSTLTFDLKGENYDLTSGYRKEKLGQVILKFAPYQEKSISYNPLSEIRLKTKYEFRDTQIIADILTEPGEGKQRDHWDLSASTFLVGMILEVLYRNPQAGLGDVVDFLTDPKLPLDKKLTKMLSSKYTHTTDEGLFKDIYGYSDSANPCRHPKISQTVAEIMNKADKERASVISSALAKLTLFKDPIVRGNTTRVDFRIEDLMFYEKPVNLYVVIEPEAIAPLSPIMRMLITQVIGRLTRDLEEPGRKNRLLLMLDEFPAFGKIELLEKALAYIAGYKMKAVLIGQSLNQLDKSYGEKNSVLDNCNASVFYAPNPNDDKTPKLISEKMGNQTIEVSSSSRKEFSFEGLNISKSKQARNLMTPEEIRTLPENRNILFFSGYPPMKGVKIKYYLEPFFLEKTKIKPPELEKIYREEAKSDMPSQEELDKAVKEEEERKAKEEAEKKQQQNENAETTTQKSEEKEEVKETENNAEEFGIKIIGANPIMKFDIDSEKIEIFIKDEIEAVTSSEGNLDSQNAKFDEADVFDSEE